MSSSFSIYFRSNSPAALAVVTLLAALPALGVRADSEPAKRDARVVLPDGPSARAWSGVGSETQAIGLDEALFEAQPWLLNDESSSDATAAWRGWGALVKQESAAEESDPAARAALALFAQRQGRWRDAWTHLERLGGFPEWSAAVMPMLLPGVAIDSAVGIGGLPAALPDGVLLTPAVPPETGQVRPGRIQTRSASVQGLRIGEATVDFKITIDGSGIEVDLLHTGGGPATVRVFLPEPEGLEIRVEYIDWMRQDVMRLPLLVELLPGEEEHNLFGRFKPRRVPLPASPQGELPRKKLPRALERGGLWFESNSEGELEAEVRAAAEVMSSALGVPGGLTRGALPESAAPWNATLLHVPSEPAEARRFLAQIAARVEAWTLGRQGE